MQNSPSSQHPTSVSKCNEEIEEELYAGSFNIPDQSGMYWHGALGQTTNQFATPSRDGKPIFGLDTNIIPPPSTNDPENSSSGSSSTAYADEKLSFAIISTFILNPPWLSSLLPPGVPVILITQPDEDGCAKVFRLRRLPYWVFICPELVGGKGCMHVKLLLLFYNTGRLRVVIPTANMVSYEWRDIENSVWLQDIPPRTKSASDQTPSGASTGLAGRLGSQFAERLERVLERLNVAPVLKRHSTRMEEDEGKQLPLKSLDELHTGWDWSRVSVHLVSSIAGRHTGWPAVSQMGHVALMKVIREMGAADERVKLECQTSSIGNYAIQWTNEFMRSAKGLSPDSQPAPNVSKMRRVKTPHPTGFTVVYPSLRTVDESVLGRTGPIPISCRRKQWEWPTAPREHFADSNSKRGKILLHSKMILGLLDDSRTTSRKLKGWLYVGSHNFTPSAWGYLVNSGSTLAIHLNNYELGVVMPLESVEQGDELACWERPPRAYVKGQDEPWIPPDSAPAETPEETPEE